MSIHNVKQTSVRMLRVKRRKARYVAAVGLVLKMPCGGRIYE